MKFATWKSYLQSGNAVVLGYLCLLWFGSYQILRIASRRSMEAEDPALSRLPHALNSPECFLAYAAVGSLLIGGVFKFYLNAHDRHDEGGAVDRQAQIAVAITASTIFAAMLTIFVFVRSGWFR